MKPQSTNLLPAILVIAVLVLGGCALDDDSVADAAEADSDIMGLWHFNEGTGQAVTRQLRHGLGSVSRG